MIVTSYIIKEETYVVVFEIDVLMTTYAESTKTCDFRNIRLRFCVEGCVKGKSLSQNIVGVIP